MERNFQAFCPKGHLVIRLCNEEDCKKEAIICGEGNCEFSINIKDVYEYKFNEFIEKLKRKGRSAGQLGDTVIEFYQQVMKKLEIDLSEYLKTKSQTGFKLFGDEQKLFKYFSEGPVDEVKPSLVFKINQLLKKQPFTLKDNKLDQILKVEIQSVQKILQSVKSLWKNNNLVNNQIINNNIDYCFHQDFRNKQRTIIKEKNKYIEFNNKKSVALTLPPIQTTSKISFKVLKFYSLRLCICYKTIVKQNNFEQYFEKGGIYGVRHDGYIYSDFNQNQHNKSSSFRFKLNDIIQLQCNMDNQKLIFTNKTTPCPILQMNFIKQQNDTLHFGLSGQHSQAQIVVSVNQKW